MHELWRHRQLSNDSQGLGLSNGPRFERHYQVAPAVPCC